jgi:hypothetical protein
MPCFDKKLEASRDDFYNDMYSTRDVDCVVSTGIHRVCLSIAGGNVVAMVTMKMVAMAVIK